MNTISPDAETVRTVLTLAVRAPSITTRSGGGSRRRVWSCWADMRLLAPIRTGVVDPQLWCGIAPLRHRFGVAGLARPR